ncbi:MAG: helix-turn-helix domain-containing protein [Bacteroidota bacterium]
MAKKNVFKRSLSLVLLLFAFVQLANSQQLKESIIDTLSFQQIQSVWKSDYNTYSEELFSLHIAKARKENDTLQWANAHRMQAWGLPFEEAIENITIAFDLASTIKKINTPQYENFLLLTHFTLLGIFYNNEYNVEAAEEAIKTYNLAVKTNDYDVQILTKSILADIKAQFGQENEGVALAKQNLQYITENKNVISRFSMLYCSSLEQLGRCYLLAKRLDSSEKYIKSAIKYTKGKNELFEDYQHLVILNAKLEYYKGNYRQAKDTLIKYLNNSNYYSYDFSGVSMADDLYYLASIEGRAGKSDLKITYLERIDSILQNNNYPLMDNTNIIYQYLLQNAIQSNDTLLEKKYFNRLVYYDTLLTNTHERLRGITLHEFDLPLEEEEKNTLAGIIQGKSKWLNLFYIVSTLLLLGTVAVYFKYQNTRKKLTAALNYPVVQNSTALDKKVILDNKLNQEVISPILSRLEVWEKEKGFLDSTINQKDLAKQLGTNSTYLSQAINLYKGQNFSSYIKDLRITLAINALKENPGLAKEKSMIQLAELFGFNSLSVFNKAFKSKIGVTPGVFLKQLFKTKG